MPAKKTTSTPRSKKKTGKSTLTASRLPLPGHRFPGSSGVKSRPRTSFGHAQEQVKVSCISKPPMSASWVAKNILSYVSSLEETPGYRGYLGAVICSKAVVDALAETWSFSPIAGRVPEPDGRVLRGTVWYGKYLVYEDPAVGSTDLWLLERPAKARGTSPELAERKAVRKLGLQAVSTGSPDPSAKSPTPSKNPALPKRLKETTPSARKGFVKHLVAESNRVWRAQKQAFESQKLVRCLNLNLGEDAEVTLADGFEKAFVGTFTRCGQPTVAAYDYNAMVTLLVKRDRMEFDEAREYLDFNVVGAWVGPETPAVVNFFGPNGPVFPTTWAYDVRRELMHLVRLLEPLEREGKLNVPGLATLNGAREALAKSKED